MADTQPDNFASEFPLLTALVGDVGRFTLHLWGRRAQCASGASSLPCFSLADVESLLDTAIRSPSIRLVQDGRPRPASDWTSRLKLGGLELDDVADARKVTAAFRDGATVVLQGLHRTWPALVAYGRELEHELSHPVQINAYLTPPASRGLARHTDAHDVFVVQTAGAKRWWIDGLGDTTLRPGDVAYVPAGTAHRAESTDTVSLHLTIGVLRRTGRHAVVRALRDLQDLDLPLPLGFARRPDELAEHLRCRLQHAAAELRDHDAADLATTIAAGARPRSTVTGALCAVERATAIVRDSRLVWRQENQVETDAQGATIRADGRWLTVPPTAMRAIRGLGDAGELRVGELPGLDAESQIVLARRLTRERFVDLPDESS